MTTTPPIRLAFGSVLLSLFLMLSIWTEIKYWNRLDVLQAQRGTGFRVAFLIFISPQLLLRSFLNASIATVVLDILVRIGVRPLMARWYRPTPLSDEFGSPLVFRLASNEKILDEFSARIVNGRLARPGTLVRTDQRFWFAPYDWACEPWSIESKNLVRVATKASKSVWRVFLKGVPDRLAFGDNAGNVTEFLVASPRELLSHIASGNASSQSRPKASA